MEVMIDCRILSLSRINARMETDGWRRVSAARIHSEDFIYGCDAMRCDAMQLRKMEGDDDTYYDEPSIIAIDEDILSMVLDDVVSL